MVDVSAAQPPLFVEWRSIPGSDYEASNDGQVRSVDRVVEYSDGRVHRHRGHLLKPQRNPRDERHQVAARVNGKMRSFYIHVLVCSAFHGPKPGPGFEVRHLNGIKTDNRPENLRWGTHSENVIDMVEHGTHHYVRRTHCKRGHLISEENTYYCQARGGFRQCLACIKFNARRRTERRREANRVLKEKG